MQATVSSGIVHSPTNCLPTYKHHVTLMTSTVAIRTQRCALCGQFRSVSSIELVPKTLHEIQLKLSWGFLSLLDLYDHLNSATRAHSRSSRARNASLYNVSIYRGSLSERFGSQN